VGIDQLRTDQVYAVIEAIVANGQTDFRPGHIADALREAGSPMLSWEIRGELSRLEAEGLISADATTGAFALFKAASKKTG
jgi:Fe2+ or Zn2+ uptake regulation protein